MRGRKIRNSEKKIQSFPYHVRDDPILSRVRGQCSMRIQNQRVSIATGINPFGRSVDRQLPFQVQRRRVNRIMNKKVSRHQLLWRSNYSYVRSECEISIGFIFPDPVCLPSLHSLQPRNMLNSCRSYYHAPYLERSKDVFDLRGAKFIRQKRIRRFVEALSSDPKTTFLTKIAISTINIFSNDFSQILTFDTQCSARKGLDEISRTYQNTMDSMLEHYCDITFDV